MVNESAYQEFTGKSVEEALKGACEAFKVGIGDLDFEIIAPGSRGVLGMGAEPARIVAAPVSALGGAAPKRTGSDSGRAAQPAPVARAADPEVRERAPRPAAPARAARPVRVPRPERAPREQREPREPRERRERSETTPEMITGGKEILETLVKHLDFEAEVRLVGEEIGRAHV